ncbi:hypothetical protein CXB51_002420 [Gossypium anomalum]|uniref:Delta(14)-sterol reductase n=1 Tax=Gossypium anomalum TaxID=47600 RepID=A0A8J5ZLY3_9ROSI|nr:hypothetical protein CXB51_002420 [Gossypium anomalum]
MSREMDLGFLLQALIPSWISVAVLLIFFAYLAIAGSILPGKLVPGVTLQDGSRLYYRCNGLRALLLLVGLLGIGSKMSFVSPTVISDRGLELLSATFIFSFLTMVVLYAAGCRSRSKGSSLKPHITGNLIHDWWYGIQLNPQFMGIDLKFFFVRAGMMGWLIINLSVLAKSVQDGFLSQSMILYQLFCAFYILDYFVHEEYMTSTWDIIAERHMVRMLWVMASLCDCLRFESIDECFPCFMGWWLLNNKVELTTAAAIANCILYLEEPISKSIYSNRTQKRLYGVNLQRLSAESCLLPVIGKISISPLFPLVIYVIATISFDLSVFLYRGIARHSNYLGDLLLALSFSLPCGLSSLIPYFYPIYLFILLVWRERRDEARCAEKYKDIWAEYCRLVPWRIFPYLY